ncbi:MAG: CopG family transcriptional regulator [Candidatus Acididesulfobacter diazotrophicus]|jgi:metal-responsive CopG/Arc/MetJ family transcriptional regulator|uniref:CopG family transcriptional regulator n=1 Tax=Candidatus Acididesulfobacter diazotrophicus TaxID=2597226 RepID=A0A519BKI3_9DELT|nr:MAG: CopG family transcriptional regulator [Candidatus Acididesulfobacter diazotrophicus]
MNKYVNVKRINITLDKELAEDLELFTKELNQKKSKIIENALIFYFDSIDTKIAEKRLKQLEDKEILTIPAADVYNKLGI